MLTKNLVTVSATGTVPLTQVEATFTSTQGVAVSTIFDIEGNPKYSGVTNK